MNLGLRLRVALWSTAANGAVLLAGILLLFWVLDQQLTGALDEALAAQARATANAVETWLADEKGEPSAVLASDEGKAGLLELFTPPKDVPSTLPTMVSLLDSRGAMVLSTHTPNAIDQPGDEVLKLVRTGVVHRAETTMTDALDRETSYRVATVPVHVRGIVEAFVQVLVPLQNLKGTLTRVEWLLGVSGLTLMLLNAWLVSLTLARAFRPVDRLVAEIHQISDKNLSVRVPVPRAKDEIRRLAETFNAMLDRVDQGFQFQTRLFQDLSHQLKTPLAILNGTLETSLSQARSADEYRAILESNLDEVARMTQLIESLLLLARLDSQQVVLQTKSVDWGGFCQAWAEDFALLWESKNLVLDWAVSGPLPVFLDPDRIGQALLNLLDNAVKFSPVGGRLGMRLFAEAGFAVLEMTNQGPVIAPGTEESLFIRFARENNGTPGFGLGLPIARAAAELHGGSLTAFQPAAGGAGFRLRLPLGGGKPEKSLIGD